MTAADFGARVIVERKRLADTDPAGEAGAVVQFAYVTGWRIPSEVLTLEWRQVDFEANEIRIDPGVTKGGEGRVFPMTPDVRKLLEAQRAQMDALKKHGIVCPYVFQRNGKPITSIIKAFKAGCRAAGYPGRIPHDLRRSAVRNLVRSGIPESVAMKLTGHRTRSVFERYNIVSDGDLLEALHHKDDEDEAGQRDADVDKPLNKHVEDAAEVA